MKLAVGNVHVEVREATAAEVAFLSGYLVFEDPKSRYMPSVQAGAWDGKYRFFDPVRRSFPAGLLPLVSRGAAREGHALDVLDERVPEAVDRGADLSWLRDYQREAVEACLAATRGLVHMATGSGKTEVFAALTAVCPCQWLVLVDQTDLLHQAADRIEARTGEAAGRVGDGRRDVRRVTVATFQALHHHAREEWAKELLASARGLVVDEAHVTAASTYTRLVGKVVNAYWRFGFSGTPLQRGDRRNIYVMATTGSVVYKLDPQRLIDAGVLARPVIRFVRYEQPAIDPDLDWNAVYARGIVRSGERNAALVEVARRAVKPCLLFIKELEQGHTLGRLLRDAGLSAEFVHGINSTPQRTAAVKRMVRGDLDVLITSSIFNKGKDIPEVRSLIVAAAGKDVITAIQRLGRGLRVAEGKAEVELWDFDDRSHLWLRRHTRKRRAAYEDCGYEVEMVDLPRQPALPGTAA